MKERQYNKKKNNQHCQNNQMNLRIIYIERNWQWILNSLQKHEIKGKATFTNYSKGWYLFKQVGACAYDETYELPIGAGSSFGLGVSWFKKKNTFSSVSL